MDARSYVARDTIFGKEMFTGWLTFFLTLVIVGGAVLLVTLTDSVWLIVLASITGLVLCLPVFYCVWFLLSPLRWLEQRIKDALASAPVKAAKQAFNAEHEEDIAWTRSIEESERYVVSISYGQTRPPRLIFYEVDKETLTASVLHDDSPYRSVTSW